MLISGSGELEHYRQEGVYLIKPILRLEWFLTRDNGQVSNRLQSRNCEILLSVVKNEMGRLVEKPAHFI